MGQGCRQESSSCWFVQTERFLGKIVVCCLIGPGTASSADLSIFAFTAFALQAVEISEGFEYLIRPKRERARFGGPR